MINNAFPVQVPKRYYVGVLHMLPQYHHPAGKIPLTFGNLILCRKIPPACLRISSSVMPASPTPSPLILHRLRRLWEATHAQVSREVTTAWLSFMLVRIDGGPPVDGGELGPALRALGYRPVRRRVGRRRVNAWLLPNTPPARVGRAPGDVCRGDSRVWPPASLPLRRMR
jgi:hypothetical protein